MPCVFRPLTKPGPAEMPTIAMKMFRPTEFMNQTVGVGMRPKDGRTERSQPPMIPAISAPPAVESVSGTPCHLEHQRADQRADHDERADERHVGDVGRAVRDAEHLGGGGDVLRAADQGEQVAAIDSRCSAGSGCRWRSRRA